MMGCDECDGGVRARGMMVQRCGDSDCNYVICCGGGVFWCDDGLMMVL
jgi:hypothetical protein